MTLLLAQPPLNWTDPPDWSPFLLATSGQRSAAPRSIHTPEGRGDRLRYAAFAELQSVYAFIWASQTLPASPSIQTGWLQLAQEEYRHYQWLRQRMLELQVDPAARRVSDDLWISLRNKTFSAEQFTVYLAKAEQRGLKAAHQFHTTLTGIDPITAELFLKIAHDEQRHIQFAIDHFPNAFQTVTSS